MFLKINLAITLRKSARKIFTGIFNLRHATVMKNVLLVTMEHKIGESKLLTYKLDKTGIGYIRSNALTIKGEPKNERHLKQT